MSIGIWFEVKRGLGQTSLHLNLLFDKISKLFAYREYSTYRKHDFQKHDFRELVYRELEYFSKILHNFSKIFDFNISKIWLNFSKTLTFRKKCNFSKVKVIEFRHFLYKKVRLLSGDFSDQKIPSRFIAQLQTTIMTIWDFWPVFDTHKLIRNRYEW